MSSWKRDIAFAVGAALLIELVKVGFDAVREAEAAPKPNATAMEVPLGELVGSDAAHFTATTFTDRRGVLFVPNAESAKLFGPRAPDLYDPSRGQFVFRLSGTSLFGFWTPPAPPVLAA